jgi:hypothetical protein
MLVELCTLQKAFDSSSISKIILSIMGGKYTPLPDSYGKELRGLVADLLQVCVVCMCLSECVCVCVCVCVRERGTEHMLARVCSASGHASLVVVPKAVVIFGSCAVCSGTRIGIPSFRRVHRSASCCVAPCVETHAHVRAWGTC